MVILGVDIGSNSVGSAWVDTSSGQITTGISIFPAGVDESEDKRGDPKNAKRRMTRRTRVTLARRADRKRALRVRLIEAGLLPREAVCARCMRGEGISANGACCFKSLLESTDPWELRRRGVDAALSPFEFGRVLLHLAQRRGALGLRVAASDGDEADSLSTEKDDGKVKAAINEVRRKMRARNARTFGEFIAMIRDERVHSIVDDDPRPRHRQKGPREYRDAIRNKAGSYEHCADRAMIREEFSLLWETQFARGGETAKLLTPELRVALDDESGDAVWRHKGLLFGQRRQSWDLGTLGRCVLEPTERCAPHADMHASRYLVVETVNNLKVIEHDEGPRALTSEEREKIKAYLSGPLGIIKSGKAKGQSKRTVSVTDLRELMGWGKATKSSRIRFNIETDEERPINTDWFSREVVHVALTPAKWAEMSEDIREGLNRAILRYDPEQDGDEAKLKSGLMRWAGLDPVQAERLVLAWKSRPKLDSKRLNISRKAVRNLLTIMDRAEPWPDTKRAGGMRWLTQIEARKVIAEDPDFRDVTTGRPLDEHARRRYCTGAKGASARDRHYMRKHLLSKDGQPIFGPDGKPLAEPPPAPLVSNPVVRKAIHEVRRHIVEYLMKFGRKPDEVYIELAREARMGKKDADQLLFRNRLRNRIRRDIIRAFDIESQSSTQQRAAVDRVVLCVQQGGVCPLCGNQAVSTKITPRMAACGEGCEVAHIIPRGSGGHNGLTNIVLSHTKCNRDMGRRTPRQFWSQGPGFENAIRWIEGIYGDIERPSLKGNKDVNGDALWLCYFTKRDDNAKIEQFKKDIKDIQQMTPRQEAATKYAARQVMAYIADALFDGGGLPERSGERRIFATDGRWTSWFRREWGLFFDAHAARAKGLGSEEEHVRKEKNRGDHRHHAIDAVVIALCSQRIQIAWEEREKQAERDGANTADEVALENYRRNHPIPPPAPFASSDVLRTAVKRAVFGDGEIERPLCHRPVKRKLIGALHEETLFGPVLDSAGKLTCNYTAKKSVLQIEPNHLRMPRPETEKEAVERLALRRQERKGVDDRAARKWARLVVSSPGYRPSRIDPPPGKSGIVRDVALRARLRQCLNEAGLDPDDFTANQIKKLAEAGGIRHVSGVPIRSVALLRTMSDPVITSRWGCDHKTGNPYKVYDAATGEGDAAAARAYVGGNNHHIEIREDKRGNWSGVIVPAFEAAQRNLARLRAIRAAGVPNTERLRKLASHERTRYAAILREIEKSCPLVDRRDDEAVGGRFVMSLCEGETLLMRHKSNDEVSYFVVAKLDKPNGIVLVRHWDARAATERKDAEGNRVPDSKREQFTVTPRDLKGLAPPGHDHAVKVRVSPLGDVIVLERD